MFIIFISHTEINKKNSPKIEGKTPDKMSYRIYFGLRSSYTKKIENYFIINKVFI